MTVALLSVGTELTRGEITNTNASWLAAELTTLGFAVSAIETVPDITDVIVEALRRLAKTNQFLLVSGGLGPTTDDLSAACAAEAASVELVRDESTLLAIQRRVEARGRTLNAGHEKQALVPSGADILPNANGTAPGFAVRIGECTAYFLPGVPREMKPMFADQIAPRIRPAATNDGHQIKLRTYGLGESSVGLRLDGIEARFPGVTLAYRIHSPEVDVKIHARSGTQTAARELAVRAADEVRSRLGDIVFGEEDEEFPEVVGRALRSRGLRLAVAESCTGGLVSHLLTTYPASDFFIGAAVTYANAAKTRILGVSEDTLRGHGAVSAEVAAEMASGARSLCGCDVALSITGIAGPSGGTTEKPVGLVHWAVAHPSGTIVQQRIFAGDRDEIQRHAAFAALDLLRRITLGLSTNAPS